jgi:hypothetical protein
MNTLYLPIEVERIIVRAVHKSISIDVVIEAFNMTHLAEIQSAVFVPRSVRGVNEPYHNAILMVKNWQDNKGAKNFQVNLRENARETKLIYDDPWYWVINEDVGFYQNDDFEINLDFKNVAAAAATVGI